jgi:hypothetical protein
VQQIQPPQQRKSVNGDLRPNGKSRSKETGSAKQTNGSTFDPMKSMLKLLKTIKVKLANGQVKWEKVDAVPSMRTGKLHLE